MSDNKLYSIINSKGLAGYFIKSQSIILTTIDKEINSLSYYFNSLKKNEEKTYHYKKINNKILVDKFELNKGENFKRIVRSDLLNTLDPLSAVELILFNNVLNPKCNNRKKIFDGDDVYLVFLTQNKIALFLLSFF